MQVMSVWRHICEWVEIMTVVKNNRLVSRLVLWISPRKERTGDCPQVLWVVVSHKETVKQQSLVHLHARSEQEMTILLSSATEPLIMTLRQLNSLSNHIRNVFFNHFMDIKDLPNSKLNLKPSEFYFLGLRNFK